MENIKILINQYKNNECTLKSLISKIKNNIIYAQLLYTYTSFLDEYNADILERLYYIINDIYSPVKCKYCNNKAKWSGRIKDGYKLTCCCKECESKRISGQKQGSNVISKNRNTEFSNWEKSVTYINDDIIKENIKYEKHISLITNPIIIQYLETRYNDSSSNLETYKRIKLGIEEKPKCPICGKPVTFIGKKSKMFTKYCSNECAGKAEETINKKKQTQLENWGSECCYNSDKYKEKLKEKYGVEYISQIPEVIEKKKQTWVEKYGVEHISQNEDIKQKVYETTKKNVIYGTSHEEEQIYIWLTELYDNVEHHYKSNEYPFNCDFYIPQYNLYIEYQGSYYHNKRAYLDTPEDKKELEGYISKVNELLKENKNPKLLSLIDTWSKRDVIKRQHAYDNNLNFLELYSCKSKDELKRQIDFWFNCYYNKNVLEYTDEQLQNDFNRCKNINNVTTLTYNKQNLSTNIIKCFQENIFYKHEKELYANNPIIRRKLIQNRIKYLYKEENEISSLQILTGFKKSGIYYGYSHFNPEWTTWFVKEYNIKTIYDPCGGWGHHMLGMLSCDKIIYNDINEETCNNVRSIKNYFNIDNLYIHCGDGRTYIPEDVDAFFMCPPYYNLEIYSDESKFNNTEEYKQFISDIFSVWDKNQAKLFGIIIRDDFEQYFDKKWAKKIEILNKNTHLFKERKNKEFFYIFEN